MKKSIFTAVVIIMAASGCGRNYTGSYTGTEKAQLNGAPIPEGSVTLTLTQAAGDQINGTWVGSNGSGTFTGNLVNGNQINNVNMTYTAANVGYNSYPYNPGYVPQTGIAYPGFNCSGTFTGTLNLINRDQITGTLLSDAPVLSSATSTTPTVTPQSTPASPYNPQGYCAGTRSVSAARTN